MTAKEYLRQAYRLNERIDSHIEELENLIKNAVVISATQFAHLMETGYASFEAEISDLEKKIKTSTGEEKTKL